jgi:hypothetical protein
MSAMLAILVYLLAMGIPLYLLFRYHSQSWYWHLLSVAAAVGLGFLPLPSQLQRPEFDLVFGFLFIALLVWGVCGLLLFQTDSQKHHHKHA